MTNPTVPILILLRGIPGSGKSTLAKKIRKNREENGEEIQWFEADQYFEGKNSDYIWNPSKLHRAHEVCFLNTKQSLESGINTVVSNTFVRRKELNPYISLANDLNTVLVIHTCKGLYGNVHGVPLKKVEQMKQNFVEDSQLFTTLQPEQKVKIAYTEEEIFSTLRKHSPKGSGKHLRNLEEALDDF